MCTDKVYRVSATRVQQFQNSMRLHRAGKLDKVESSHSDVFAIFSGTAQSIDHFWLIVFCSNENEKP